jgi:hypothetical protein
VRFKQFLESRDASFLDHLEKVAETCAPFLDNKVSTLFLYRGARDIEQQLTFFAHRKTRTPRDSDAGFNAMFNIGVESLTGVTNIRAKSVFATGNRYETTEYGDPYFFFPCGNFSLVYSKEVCDSYIDSHVFYERMDQQLQIGRTTASIMRNFSFRNPGVSIEEATLQMKDQRVMEEVFSEVGVNISPSNFYDAIEHVFKSLSYVQASTPGVNKAIESGNEILVYESDGFWMLSRNAVWEYVSNNPRYDGATPEEFLDNYFSRPRGHGKPDFS